MMGRSAQTKKGLDSLPKKTDSQSSDIYIAVKFVLCLIQKLAKCYAIEIKEQCCS